MEKKTTYKNKVKVVEIPEATGMNGLCIIWNLVGAGEDCSDCFSVSFCGCKKCQQLEKDPF